MEVNHAAIRDLDVEAAWTAAEAQRQENDMLRQQMQISRTERDRYATRSYGYTRIASVYKRIQSKAITQEQGWQFIVEAIEETDKRLEKQVYG
jgi:hypothetical protein